MLYSNLGRVSVDDPRDPDHIQSSQTLGGSPGLFGNFLVAKLGGY